MAKTKAGGSTKLGRDSVGKRLGVKRSDGQTVNPGEIIIRQRGTKYLPGINVKRGSDDTLYAMIAGQVKFQTKKKINFNNHTRIVKVVGVRPLE